MSGAATVGQPELDLDAYLERIGYRGPVQPDVDTLTALQLGHVTRIPFENIDVQLGLPIRLDLASVQAKLVGSRRGGYCFEHNTLMAAVLDKIGFHVVTLAARVRYQATAMTPRTHMLLRVTLGEHDYLVDTAFGGGFGPVAPLRLHTGVPQAQDLVTFQLARTGDVHRLFVRLDEGFTELYEFTLEPQFPVDFELANHYTSTHPSSRFVTSLIVTIPAPGKRYVLRNLELSVRSATPEGARAPGAPDTEVTRRALRDDAELRELLRERFGLLLPEGASLGDMRFTQKVAV